MHQDLPPLRPHLLQFLTLSHHHTGTKLPSMNPRGTDHTRLQALGGAEAAATQSIRSEWRTMVDRGENSTGQIRDRCAPKDLRDPAGVLFIQQSRGC